MMKKTLSFFLFLSITLLSFSQDDYFQQEVNYKIAVSLNDENHSLSGTIEMEYTNHSPDQLDFIYFHLWANAYKNKNTAFAKQNLRMGSTRFYFAHENDLGHFSNLLFTVDGKECNLEFDKENPDIAILHLNQALKSGGKITIKTPFDLKIPKSFSRLGHVGQSYQMTQWYPKPAVYDKEGWHQMPYLDMGEFYSEFGSFEVSINLPSNYVVGATGTLQTESEKTFLQEKVEATNLLMKDDFPETDTFPTSSTERKTIQYMANKVHDFAWFADKRFHVQKDQVTLASGKIIDTWAMFTNTEAEIWKRGIDYVSRSVKYYSDKVGEYPWPQATAVQSALSAGAGMEYPMITVIGKSGSAISLDEVITHEVGHNWFYGILGSNERTHAWMDEGLNTFIEGRYMHKYYEGNAFDEMIPKIVSRGKDIDLFEKLYHFQCRRALDQSCETHSNEFAPINYQLGAYTKPAMIFKYLQNYLGTDKFDNIMHSYFDTWKFKHPQPNDIRKHWEKESGKNLSWIFDDFIGSTKQMDYAITKIKKEDHYKLTVKNKGEINAPFSISALNEKGEIINTQWFEGFEGQKEINFNHDKDFTRLELDAQKIAPEVYRHNNSITISGRSGRPLDLKLVGTIQDESKNTLHWMPILAWNNYDKTMLGLAIHNKSIPFRKFEFSLAPMYSFVTKDINGLAHVKYHFYPKGNTIQHIALGISGKSFNNAYNWNYDYNLQYYKVKPKLLIELKNPLWKTFRHHITIESHFIFQEQAMFQSDSLGTVYQGNETTNSIINQISYTFENNKKINPHGFTIALEQQNYKSSGKNQHYLKASLEAKASFTYKRFSNIDFRFFAGGFLDNTQRNSTSVSNSIARGSFSLISRGVNDYTYDEYYFGRSDQTGIWTQQISLQDGGMKNAITSGVPLAQSNNFILALNIKADLPIRLPLGIPLKPYFDLGYFDYAHWIGIDPVSFQDQFIWSGGLMLDFRDGLFGVYFPLINSENIKINSPSNYFSQISFNINFNQMNLFELVDKIRF